MQILFEVPDDLYFRLQKVLNERGMRKAIYNALTEQVVELVEGADHPKDMVKAIITKKVRFRLDE